MTTHVVNTTRDELMTLLGTLVQNSEGLIRRQLELLQREVGRELGKATEAAGGLGAGAGLVATGGLLSTVMLVHLLHRASRLPLWACYGLVSGGLVAAGAALLARGRRSAAGVRLDLPETTAGLQANLAWLKAQLTPAR
jgi:Putative Actinobacterial Holin-X, holin superfamily III